MPFTPSNLNYTAFLSLDPTKARSSAGSGFYLQHKGLLHLITAKHVLFDENGQLRCKEIVASTHNARGKLDMGRIIEIEAKQANVIYHPTHDVAAVTLRDGEYTIQQEGDNVQPINSTEFIELKDIQVAADVFVIGYPVSLASGNDFDLNRPLLRKGVIAGIHESKATFVIDCPTYYGNSGGPVIVVNSDGQFSLCGLVSRYIPFYTEWRNNRERDISHVEFANSGYTVVESTDSILELLN